MPRRTDKAVDQLAYEAEFSALLGMTGEEARARHEEAVPLLEDMLWTMSDGHALAALSFLATILGRIVRAADDARLDEWFWAVMSHVAAERGFLVMPATTEDRELIIETLAGEALRHDRAAKPKAKRLRELAGLVMPAM